MIRDGACSVKIYSKIRPVMSYIIIIIYFVHFTVIIKVNGNATLVLQNTHTVNKDGEKLVFIALFASISRTYISGIAIVSGMIAF